MMNATMIAMRGRIMDKNTFIGVECLAAARAG